MRAHAPCWGSAITTFRLAWLRSASAHRGIQMREPDLVRCAAGLMLRATQTPGSRLTGAWDDTDLTGIFNFPPDFVKLSQYHSEQCRDHHHHYTYTTNQHFTIIIIIFQRNLLKYFYSVNYSESVSTGWPHFYYLPIILFTVLLPLYLSTSIIFIN